MHICVATRQLVCVTSERGNVPVQIRYVDGCAKIGSDDPWTLTADWGKRERGRPIAYRLTNANKEFILPGELCSALPHVRQEWIGSGLS